MEGIPKWHFQLLGKWWPTMGFWGARNQRKTHLWSPAVSLADLFSELDPPLNDLNLWKFRLQQPGLTHELAAGRWLGLFIGDHEGTQPVLFHPWLNFTNLTSGLINHMTQPSWLNQCFSNQEDKAGQCRTHGQHNADPKTWHHGQHTKSASETTSQTLLAHQIPARNSVASRMENVCGSSVEMIANDAETYRNHELENRKSRIAPWAEDRRSLEIFGSNLDLIKETGNMWKHAQISPMTKPKSATACNS